jgi:CRISPR-associated protein Csx17
MRNGQSFMGVSLGQVAVHPHADGDLLKEVEEWLNRFRTAAMKKNKEDDEKRGSARFRSALRQIERAIFDYCQHGGSAMFQHILISLGRAEALIASASRFREEAKGLRPITLTSAWIAAAEDPSDEFRIALALSSIFEPEPKVGSIRRNLEPIETTGRFLTWAEKDRAVVWTTGDLSGNLAAILTRRAMDAERIGGKAHALKSGQHAPLSAVCAFLAGSLDESRIADLLWGLCLCDSRNYHPVTQEASDSQPLPSCYSLLKLLFLPPDRYSSAEEAKAPNAPDARVLALLRADRLAEACQRAAQVLRGRRQLAKPQAMHGHPNRDNEWAETRWPGLSANRLAAALLIPIHPLAVESLEKRILRPAKPHAA